MMKRRYTCLIIVFLVISCAVHAAVSDTAYIASKVVMSHLAGSQEMALLGKTSDGYQIWFCPNDSKMAYERYAQWTIDDGDPISQANRSYFDANVKWELTTDFNDSYRRVSSDTTAYHFLKVKTQKTADFFTWDLKQIPSFAKEFRLAGTITPYVANINIEDDEKHVTHQVAIDYDDFYEGIFDHARIEYSCDKGNTWLVADPAAPTTTATSVTLSNDKNQVRYRVTVFPANCFSVVMEKDSFVVETSDYSLLVPIYNANQVIMNTGTSGTNIYMTCLGCTKVGYQIWACQGIDSHRYTYWKIDNGEKLSLSIGDFYSNTDYTLMTDYISSCYRDVPDGTQHYHFIKVKGKEAADYFTWYGDKAFHPYSFYMFADLLLQPAGNFSVNDTQDGIQQNLTYTFNGVNGEMIDHLSVEASYDGGQTWNEVHRSVDGTFNGGIQLFSGTVAASLTGEGDSVRYRVTVYPKDCYKVLVENGCWTYETANCPVVIPDVDITVKANAINRTTYSDNDTPSKRTYTANVTWSAQSKLPDWVRSVNFKYSTDNGNTWLTADGYSNTDGTQDIKVPVGFTRYLVSAEPSLKGKLDSLAALHRTFVAAKPLIVDYEPAIYSFAVESCVDVSGCGQLRSVTCSYMLNEDLWQTRNYAVISYSYDNGKTWRATKEFMPGKTGRRTLMVDASNGQCRLRLEVASLTDGTDKICSAKTTDLTF